MQEKMEVMWENSQNRLQKSFKNEYENRELQKIESIKSQSQLKNT